MSIGAEMSGVDVRFAVEADPHAARTFRENHPGTTVLEQNIKNIKAQEHICFERGPNPVVIFGGPPCQGFSTSNQKTETQTTQTTGFSKNIFDLSKK